MAPASAGDAAKAYRLRKAAAAGTISPIDKLWLVDYEEKAERRKKAAAESIGASRRRAGRRVKLDIEEHEDAEAVGTGTAAEAAASAALAVKEEGRRLDALTIESVGALKEAVAVYRDVCLTMRRRMDTLEGHHIMMLDAVREQYLARTQAEIDAMEASNEKGDTVAQLAEALLPELLKKGMGPSNGKAS
jgi:hypothetical protein